MVQSIDRAGNEQLSFKELYLAYRRCLKGKRGTQNAIAYQIHALDKLYTQWECLQRGQYQPKPAVSFVTTRPKAREIIAADFADRVVHHWLVGKLEPLFEPMLIHDLYSNRKNKGTHKAVKRLQGMMHASGGNAGYFLQLDVKNFFNSIDHQILLAQLGRRFKKCIGRGVISRDWARQCYLLARTIIQHPVAAHAHYKNSPAQRALVPAHKQLQNAPSGKGLPIGNLTSQFFANVYLNDLDQFIKHQLKCPHYVRYVDDFVLLHQNEQQLLQWRAQIVDFLKDDLDLRLKALAEPKRNQSGADFLGFIVRPHYRLVRHRVSAHCLQKLHDFATAHIRRTVYYRLQCFELNATDAELAQLLAMLESYWGHFRHAHCLSTIAWVLAHHEWLKVLFEFAHTQILPRYQNRNVHRFNTQCDYFNYIYPHAKIFIQCGYAYRFIAPRQAQAASDVDLCIRQVRVVQSGFLKNGLRHRVATHFVFSLASDLKMIALAA